MSVRVNIRASVVACKVRYFQHANSRPTAVIELAGDLNLANKLFNLSSFYLSNVLVLRQNGSGQNGTDKMVWTKWYGQNGMAKILRI